MKLDAIHIILYGAPFVLGFLHMRFPQWDSAIGAMLTLALVVAINTHKPGAQKVIEQLQAAAVANAPAVAVVTTKEPQ